MPPLLTDPYQPGSSPIHRWNPRFKVVCTLFVIILTGLAPTASWAAFLTSGTALLVGIRLAGLSLASLGWRLLALEPLACGIALMALFHADGLRLFLSLLIRSTLCLAWTLLLASTTPFSGILAALRSLGLPGLFITVLALAYRYLFVLADEAERMARARRSRTLTPNGRMTWPMIATVAGHLFLRASDRADRLFAAMTARGWKR